MFKVTSDINVFATFFSDLGEVQKSRNTYICPQVDPRSNSFKLEKLPTRCVSSSALIFTFHPSNTMLNLNLNLWFMFQQFFLYLLRLLSALFLDTFHPLSSSCLPRSTSCNHWWKSSTRCIFFRSILLLELSILGCSMFPPSSKSASLQIKALLVKC